MRAFYTSNTSQFGLAVFQGLNRHMWLVVIIADSVILDILYFKKDIDKTQLKCEVPTFSLQVTIQL